MSVPAGEERLLACARRDDGEAGLDAVPRPTLDTTHAGEPEQPRDLRGRCAGADDGDLSARDPVADDRGRQPGRGRVRDGGSGERHRDQRVERRPVRQQLVLREERECRLDARPGFRAEDGDDLVERPRPVEERQERRQERPGRPALEADGFAAVLEDQAARLVSDPVPRGQERTLGEPVRHRYSHLQHEQQQQQQRGASASAAVR